MSSRGLQQGSFEWWTLHSPWTAMSSRGLQQGSSTWWTLQSPLEEGRDVKYAVVTGELKVLDVVEPMEQARDAN